MSIEVPESFSAFRIHQDENGHRSGVEDLSIDQQSDGDVVIRTDWSSVNYKDALAGTGKGSILRSYPLTGGIDVAGTIARSANSTFKEGDQVLVTGCGLSEVRDGGYAEYLRLDSRWLIPLPKSLTARQAMGIGTAGFTAALSLFRMEALGQSPDMGPIVVTGASGGVGSLAINILTTAGYEVHAISGKIEQFDFLEQLGASQCISRHDLYWGERGLETARWAGAIDTVGDDMLNGLTRVIKPWGNIASCGLAGGIGLHTTVMPFIIRGVSLIGINSSGCPYSIRADLWQRLGSDWRPPQLEDIIQNEVALSDLPQVFNNMLAGGSLGRTVVKVNSGIQ